MRIYDNAYELMSETGRNLYEMGCIIKPKTYQNKVIEDNPDFVTKELESEQYTLLSLNEEDALFTYSKSKEWARAEFHERISNKWINPGEAYKLREDVWEEFLRPGIFPQFDYTYNERMRYSGFYKGLISPQLQSVISLLKDDPDTRKAILTIYTISDSRYLDGSRRIPCSMYYWFGVRKYPGSDIAQLNIHYHQRSSDFVTHFGNDVYLAWKLMEYVAQETGYRPGHLIHSIDSLHVYQKDWATLKTSIQNL